MTGIYKITSPSGRVYIGKSTNITRRRYEHANFKNYKNSMKTGILYKSLVKYGWDAHDFEVIYQLPHDVENSVLNEYEKFYISQFTESGIKLMNLREGGEGGKLSEETRKKMSKSRKSKKKSKEWIEKCVNSRIKNGNNKHTEETKLKIREARSKQVISQESIMKSAKKRVENGNHIRSEEMKRKISEGLKQYHKSKNLN